MSAYAVYLLIVCSARNKDMIVASLQPEVDKVSAWSVLVRLIHRTFKFVTDICSVDCVKRIGNPASPLMENDCFAIPF